MTSLDAIVRDLRAVAITRDDAELVGMLRTVPPDRLTGAHGLDLALATLAAVGDAAAIAAIEDRCAPIIGRLCYRFAGRDHSIEDLRQILRTAVFVAHDAPPKIAAYAGNGSLANWMRVTATRTFIDVIRRRDRTREQLGGDDIANTIAASDLSLDAIRQEHRALVARALVEASRALPTGARHVLRQHFVFGASIDQIGAALGVHRATAARRLAGARDALVAGTRRRLATHLGVAEADIDAICGSVTSGIEVSIRTILASGTARDR